MTMEECQHHNLALIGENELGRWYDCLGCGTTKLIRPARTAARLRKERAENNPRTKTRRKEVRG